MANTQYVRDFYDSNARIDAWVRRLFGLRPRPALAVTQFSTREQQNEMDILKQHVGILGLPATDKVTGFEGVVESVAFDLYGCVQVVVRPRVKDVKEGDMKDGRWFDIQRLVLGDPSTRVMPVPMFKALAPEGVHTHGPADKPRR